jgi:DNA modification methylase
MRLIKFFTKTGELVLDPFSGVASTLKACALSGRKGIGIELIRKWAVLGEKRLRQEVPDTSSQRTIVGDAREELAKILSDSVDYIVTSPPYWCILGKKPDHKMKKERLENGFVTKYSNDPRDLGNIIDYREFLKQIALCFQECRRILRPNKDCSIIVSDFRHNSTYQPYHADVIGLMTEAGFALKGIMVLVQNGKSLYPYGYPYAYVPNIHHQYILNFQRMS